MIGYNPDDQNDTNVTVNTFSFRDAYDSNGNPTTYVYWPAPTAPKR